MASREHSMPVSVRSAQSLPGEGSRRSLVSLPRPFEPAPNASARPTRRWLRKASCLLYTSDAADDM
eukprot:3021855-Alexandrium_andersonii.AAC.1